MNSTNPRSEMRQAFIEQLEDRNLLSIAPSAAFLPETQHVSPAIVVTPKVAVATKTTLTTSTHSDTLGQNILLTAVVKTAAGKPLTDGSVKFLSGTKVLATVALNATTGKATYLLAPGNVALFVGSFKITAKYVGTTAFKSSLSAAQAVTVNKLTSVKNFGDGLITSTVKAGSGPAVKTGQTARVQYTGFYTSGAIFDYSTKHPSLPPYLEFVVNAKNLDVIVGFNQGVAGMKVGETRVVGMPSNLGYADGHTRIFIIKLIKIT